MDDDTIDLLDSTLDMPRKRIATNPYSPVHDRNDRGTRKGGYNVVNLTTKAKGHMAGKRKVSRERGCVVRGLSDCEILGDVSSYVESSDEEETPKKKKQWKVQGKSPAMGKRKSTPKGSTTKGKSPTENREGGNWNVAKRVATHQGRRIQNESSSGSESESEMNQYGAGNIRGSRTGGSEVDDLRDELEASKRKMKAMELELAKYTMTSRMNKKAVREQLNWTGEDTNFSETVSTFCRVNLFPKYKFLDKHWKEYLPDNKESLYSLCMKTLKPPMGADRRDIWERVMVPTIMKKYQHMKCNLNNEIKKIYLGRSICHNLFLSVSY